MSDENKIDTATSRLLAVAAVIFALLLGSAMVTCAARSEPTRLRDSMVLR